MALRARKQEQPEWGGDGVPVALLSKSHRVWQTEAATRRWLADLGLQWTDRMKIGPLNRHKEATYAWAMAFGPVRVVEQNGHRHPAWTTLRELGIPGHGGAEMLEYMNLHGIPD